MDGPLDVDAFLDRFVLTAVEAARLRDCRRLLALVWLFLLSFDEERDHPRNPPGTTTRQARRLTALLTAPDPRQGSARATVSAAEYDG
ncbi:hypothetical protein [Streptomyces winkii]|uniref:hypothetical protein n=1 Tax=Streptomyces winkii TaxID=3051178 RepID=UPI0028D906C9|nr:hypothetical protein [Streptomyces sp. DSM 40971]